MSQLKALTGRDLSRALRLEETKTLTGRFPFPKCPGRRGNSKEMDLPALYFGMRYIPDRLLLPHSPARIQNLRELGATLTLENKSIRVSRQEHRAS